MTNLERAAEQIANFKLVAVDQTSERRRDINLVEYINKVIKSLAPAIQKKRHKVKITGDKDIFINTIPGDISQIITNLLMNSITHAYTKDKQGEMLITVKKIKNKVLLTYADDGQGMDKSVSQMIFEPFFTTKRNFGGSGLGMYIVYNLVNQNLHGKITCASKLDQGTQFTMEFPILDTP